MVPGDPGARVIEAMVAEFEAWLAENAARHRGDAGAELDALWQVALEREAMVTVAYRRDIVDLRLAHMPIPDDARAVVSRAIHWAWRDEEAHTLYVRGGLARQGRLVTARAIKTQLEGRVGGWTSSRQHHLGWREAPLRRFVAEILEVAGSATGRVPAVVRDGLHFSSFREVCRFNVGAERTARLAWERMADLVDGPEADVFRRIAADEDRHARMFELFLEAFDDGDRLAPRWTAHRLEAGLSSIGQRFLTLPSDGSAAWKNHLGKGGVVTVFQGKSAADPLDGALDGLWPLVRPGATVAIKATFMLMTRRADPSPGVSIRLLRALVRGIEARGARAVVIDARNIYDRFHRGRSVPEVASWLGIGDLAIVDAQDDQVPHDFVRGLGPATVCKTWRDADLRVVLGKVRSHPTSVAMLGIEASEGLGPRHDEFVFGDRRAERETAMLMVLDAFPADFAVVDCWTDVPDGLLGMFGNPRPLSPLRIYAGTDVVAVDAVIARHLGADPADPAMTLSSAFDWLGDPRVRTSILGPDTPIAGWRLPDHDARTAALAALAMPVFTWASLRGALFLPDFDPAFPPIDPPSAALVAARRAVRALVDDPGSASPPADLLPTVSETIGGRAVRIARLGAGEVPVVLLHGYPETLQLFGPLARRLAAKHPVIALDWPGQGRSDAWPGPAGPQDRARVLLALLDAWGIRRAHVVGHDMGGQPALVLAARHPDRVASVTVMNSLLFGDAETSWEIAVMRRTGLSSAAFGLAPSVVYQRCLETFLEGDALPDALDADFYGAFSRPEVRAHLVRMCRDYDEALPDLPREYWTIRAPVRLLWAEDDRHFPIAQAERFRTLHPESRLEVLPGARHWMALTHADEVATRLLHFFEEVGWTS